MKNCTGINCIMQLGKVDPATCPAVGYCQQATPPITHADKIRSMTDEELAVWMAAMLGVNPFDGTGNDYRKWLDWLRQEAHDG